MSICVDVEDVYNNDESEINQCLICYDGSNEAPLLKVMIFILARVIVIIPFILNVYNDGLNSIMKTVVYVAIVAQL